MMPWLFSEIVKPQLLISICDIGASYLEAPKYDVLIRNNLARLIGFEPNVAECERLRQIYGAPHKFYPDFVGRGGPAIFFETNWFPTGSLLKPNVEIIQQFTGLFERITPVAEHHIQTVALDALLNEEHVDYIKIDVQGGELDVFRGASNVLENVLVIDTEVEFVEMYEAQPLFTDVDLFLRKQGFRLVKFLGPRACTLSPCVLAGDVNQGNQLAWSDALYMRDIFDLEKLSQDQLIKLATISHDVYMLSDFAHRCLSEIDRRNGSALANAYLSRFA